MGPLNAYVAQVYEQIRLLSGSTTTFCTTATLDAVSKTNRLLHAYNLPAYGNTIVSATRLMRHCFTFSLRWNIHPVPVWTSEIVQFRNSFLKKTIFAMRMNLHLYFCNFLN